MNKISILFLFFLVLVNEVQVYSQVLYFAIEDNNLVSRNPLQVEFVKQKSLREATIFYQDDFVSHDLKQDYNPILLSNSITKRIPNLQYSGVALLDWEGEKAQILYGTRNVSEHRFNEVLKEFISAIRHAKSLRPNVKWSFYGFPVRVLKDHSYNEWKKKVLKLKPLFQEMDYICPNLYMFIRADSAKYKKDITEHVALALELGVIYNKAVIPLIWNRYQTNSELIPESVFANHIKSISSTSYHGKKIDGLIWWNSEEFNFKRKSRYPKIMDEYSTVKNKNYHQRMILNTYLNSLRKNNFR